MYVFYQFYYFFLSQPLFIGRLYCSDDSKSEITSSVMSSCVRRRGLTCAWNKNISCPSGQYGSGFRYLSEYFRENPV